jgi:hypothetical protein
VRSVARQNGSLNESKYVVEGRHKAGHDDQEEGKGGSKRRMLRSFVGRPDTNPTIVMAGLVPAIHGFLVG